MKKNALLFTLGNSVFDFFIAACSKSVIIQYNNNMDLVDRHYLRKNQ